MSTQFLSQKLSVFVFYIISEKTDTQFFLSVSNFTWNSEPPQSTFLDGTLPPKHFRSLFLFWIIPSFVNWMFLFNCFSFLTYVLSTTSEVNERSWVVVRSIHFGLFSFVFFFLFGTAGRSKTCLLKDLLS